MIIVDTREKKNAHILEYFDKNGIFYTLKKLDVADYSLEGNEKVCVDRKQNLEEVSYNLMNKKDHSRFWKEVRRAKEKGIKMIVLCEHGGSITDIKSVSKWHSLYTTVSGRTLMDEIYRVHISYGVEFLFCKKCDTGRIINEILTGTYKGDATNESQN